MEPGSGKSVTYQGPLSFDLSFMRCKFTSPGNVVCNRALQFREFVKNGAAPSYNLEKARELT
jgi:hypothetical protein